MSAPFRPFDKSRIAPMLAELTATLRKHGFALAMGDGELHLYLIDSPGRDAVASLNWDENARGLRYKLVPDDERWSIEDEDWLNRSMESWRGRQSRSDPL